MKSSSVIGISLLVMAAGLAVYEPFLQRVGSMTPASSEPTPFAATVSDAMPPSGPDWETLAPKHEPLPKRRHPLHPKHLAHKKPVRQKPAEDAADTPQPDNAPLPAPTFLPSTPEPAPRPVEIVTAPPEEHIEHVSHYHPLAVVHRPKPRPTIYAPPTLSPQDLTRQRRLERSALIEAATRTSRGTVESTVPNVHILSADADDHGTYISVVIVEQRPTGTVVENFVFTPGPSALGLAQRRVISQNNADPFISH